jgi:hypothetical protein
MRLEVDQSRKVEQGGSTVLAFSDHEHGVLLVPSHVKRRVLHRLRDQGRERRASVHLVFAALVALLLRDVVKRADLVIIDDEYTGHRGMIKFQVLHYLRKLGIEVETGVITFGLVGKHSSTHHLAISVFRGQRAPDRWVTFEELWALVG